MARTLSTELEHLKKDALSLGARVEKALREAVESFRERDADLAKKVLDLDEEIDRMEVDLEEECLKTLALHQPVAIDLRLIIAIVKLNNDLERIGDLAVDLAERSYFLAQQDPVPIPSELPNMATHSQGMVKRSLDALVNLDADLARDVIAEDDRVDLLHGRMFDAVTDLISQMPDRARDLLSLLSVSRYLERIGDHATNIAEDVIYLVEGDIVRHQGSLKDEH